MIIVYTVDMVIHTDERLLTTAEAADRLGVTQNRVQAMIRQGGLRVVHIDSRRSLIPLQSVKDARRCVGHSGRPYAEGTAMAALLLLSGGRADWINPQQAYRIRRQLSQITVDDLVRNVRRRAVIREYQASVGMTQAIRGHVRESASEPTVRKQLQLMEAEVIEGYVSSQEAAELERTYRLNSDLRPIRIRLRICDHITFGGSAFSAHSPMPMAFRAADLADSSDVRERVVGMNLLSNLLDMYRKGMRQQEDLR